MIRTRFAPSPSGSLHVGHLLAALEAQQLAHTEGGQCLLRIEDIDSRCKQQWVDLMWEDLTWLGLEFHGELLRQSLCFTRYERALDILKQQGVLYPCFCTRAEIKEQMLESGRAPHAELGYQYEGNCRTLSADIVAERLSRGDAHAWRLHMEMAYEMLGRLHWEDMLYGEQEVIARDWGDPVLARKEFPASYHLCVVLDDAYQGITHVTRGLDLFSSTHLHRVIQALLDLPTPLYRHHGLICDENGKRLAKRDGARSLTSLREAGISRERVIKSLYKAIENKGIWTL